MRSRTELNQFLRIYLPTLKMLKYHLKRAIKCDALVAALELRHFSNNFANGI